MLEFNATFIIAMLSFVVFIIIMNMIFYKPIFKVIEERQKFIDENYNSAKNSKDEAQSLLDNKDLKLTEALKTSRKIIFDKAEVARKKSKEILDEARQVANAEITTAKQELKNEQATMDLDTNINEIAHCISKKLLGEI